MVTPHIHVGAYSFMIFALYFLLASAMFKLLAARLSDSPVGAALGFIAA